MVKGFELTIPAHDIPSPLLSSPTEGGYSAAFSLPDLAPCSIGLDLLHGVKEGTEGREGGETVNSDEPSWVCRRARVSKPDTDYYVTADE